MTRPLRGLRVLDLTRALAGPFCTTLLADLGADVIKVEALPAGDSSRLWGPFDGDCSLYFLSANRNKRSIAVDLRSDEGRKLLRDLVATSSVLVENFRPGVLASLGLDQEELRRIQPELIFSSITGFGNVGPERETGGFDQVAQGMSGLMSVTGTAAGAPTRVGIPIVDLLTGILAALGIAAAAVSRGTAKPVRRVETSLLESALSVMVFQAQRYLSLGEVPGRSGNDHPVLSPYGAFMAADGMVNIAVGSEKQWGALCRVLGNAEMSERALFSTASARVQNRDELQAAIESLLSKRSAGEWISRLRDAAIPCGPIYSMDEVFADPQVIALDLIQKISDADGRTYPLMRGPIRIDGDPADVRLPPPKLGEHTRQILQEVGISEADMARLLSAGIIAEGA